MKKTLLATTLLVATAGLAAAEVTLSGSGRFGLVYDGDETSVHTRIRVNIDAMTETDGGVTFGGRIRIQHRNNELYVVGGVINPPAAGIYSGATLSAAMLYMEANGFRVEVGNANGAYDSAGLMWNSEIGFTASSYGDPNNSYMGYFHSGPYNLAGDASPDAMGLFASYSAGDFTARVSYHEYWQGDIVTDDGEMSASLDWSSNGFSVSAAIVNSDWYGDTTYIGAAYAIGDSTNVGLNLFTGDYNDLITLYANHTLSNGVTIAGYVADQDNTDTAFGIGGSYDLGGGASIAGAYHDRGDENYADFGVNFSF